MALNYDPAQKTTWYNRVVEGPSGIQATAREASIFGGTPPTTPPSTDACSATYANGTLAAGASATFGFLGSWTGTDTAPSLTCTAN